MDILFKTEELVFSYRAAGILRRGENILLQKPANDAYAFIGGHVKSLETSKETLVREFEEEVHASIVVDDLFAVGEIFFPWGKKPCHQICLYYTVHLKEENMLPLEGTFHGCDEWGKERIDLDFCWVRLQDFIEGSKKVYPPQIITLLAENKKEITHFVYKET